MTSDEQILQEFKDGKLNTNETLERLRTNQLINLGHSRIDLARKGRTGVSEVIYGENKTPDQIVEIAQNLSNSGHNVLATRLKPEGMAAFQTAFSNAQCSSIARLGMLITVPIEHTDSFIGIVSAGTSDMFVAEEAALTAEFLGSRVKRFYDCGVAGLHRLFDELEHIRQAKVLIAIAGMEGALPTVLGGLVHIPIIAVPTSVGYGTGMNGFAALLSMLNSCANGVSVVNIDNGFGAAYNAHLINTIASQKQQKSK